jgi:hypothetical protein
LAVGWTEDMNGKTVGDRIAQAEAILLLSPDALEALPHQILETQL